MAMTVSVGHAGGDVRGDARVSVSAGTGLVSVTSTVMELYGEAIREQAERVLEAFGRPAVDLSVEDTGALPFVLEARLEAGLAAFLERELLPMEPSGRERSVRMARRSRLYVPGGMPKMFPNAGLYRPDVLILDLEDSVLEGEKFAARALVRRALGALEWEGCERAVRINPGATGRDDLRAIAGQGVDIVVVPKAEDPEELVALDAILTDAESGADLVPILESALGIFRAYEIAMASERVTGLAMGLEDYLTDIGARRTEEGAESVYAFGKLVNTARAAGVVPYASVYSRVEDEAGLADYCRRMRGLGFEGVGCLHPRQVRTVHRAFAPSEKEVSRAQEIVESFEAAMEQGKGAISVKGQMVDAPIYERAKTVLRRAEEGR